MNRRSAMIRTLALAFAIASATLPTPPVRASVIVKPTGAPITLDVSKGIIIRLDRPCSSVFVADPDIADVQLKSPTVLYIMGKGAGETTIYAVDQQDAVLLNSRVQVNQDVDRLERDIRQIDPSGRVRAKAVDDSIVLEGSVTDAAQGDDIRKIATRYVASPNSGRQQAQDRRTEPDRSACARRRSAAQRAETIRRQLGGDRASRG